MPAEEFKEVLGRLAADVGAGPEDTPALTAAIHTIRERLPRATNFGQTHDDADAFTLLDNLTAAVRTAYPDGRCTAGCSGCCDSQTAIFDVSQAEWTTIETHVATAWSPQRRQAFRERFRAEHGSRLGAYRGLTWVRFFEPLADRYFARKPYRCPFLEDGRCSIYAARPLACRMYGYFAIRSRFYERPSVYGCGMQTSYYEQQPQLTLPAVNMVAAQTRRLTRGRARILPLWISECL